MRYLLAVLSFLILAGLLFFCGDFYIDYEESKSASSVSVCVKSEDNFFANCNNIEKIGKV